MDMNEIGLSVHCLYKDSFSITFNDNKFKFHPTFYNYYDNIVGIVIDISEESASGEKLAMTLRKEQDDGLLTLILEKRSCQDQRQTILEVTFKDESNKVFDAFSENLNLSESTAFKKMTPCLSSRVFEIDYFDRWNLDRLLCDGYTVSTRMRRLVEVTLQIEETSSIRYTLITNPEISIKTAMESLFGNWYIRYGVFMDCTLLDTSTRFSDCGYDSPLSLTIAEKCHLTCRGGSHATVVVPWMEHSLDLAMRLATVIDIDGFGIRFIDDRGELLREEVALDIADFRSTDTSSLYMDTANGTDTSDPIALSYSISSSRVRCTSMEDTEHSVDVVIPEECSASELKERLHRKLGFDPRSLLLLQKEVMLANEAMVTVTDTVVYFVATIVERGALEEVSGTNGRIHLYRSVSSTSPIVLKRFEISSTDCGEFIQEYRIIKSLTQERPHPNIVRCDDLYIDGVDIYIGMEYVEGGSLRGYLSRHGPLNEEQIGQFSFHILQGLRHLHANKILHRDIKGPNILLGENNVPKLCDFGLSKILSNYNTSQLSVGVTQTGDRGTKRWMAPEIITGQKYGLKADIWSFGATVVEMITGDVPYPGLEATQAYYKVGTEKMIEYLKPSGMSAELEKFVDSCLGREPADRRRVDRLLESDFIKLHSHSLRQ